MVVPPSLVAMGRHRSPFLPCTMAVADWREVGIVGSTMLDYRSLSKGVRKRHELRLDSFVISVKVGMRAPIRLAFVVAPAALAYRRPSRPDSPSPPLHRRHRLHRYSRSIHFIHVLADTSLRRYQHHPQHGSMRQRPRNLPNRVLKNPKYPPTRGPTRRETSIDGMESPDDIFYTQPRLVYHIDSHAVEALTKYYTNVFQRVETDVLDVL